MTAEVTKRRTWVSARLLVLLGIIAGGVGVAVFFSSRRVDPFVPLDDATKNALNRIVIQKFELHDATPPQAVAQLYATVQQQQLPSPLRFKLWTETKPPEGFHRKVSKTYQTYWSPAAFKPKHTTTAIKGISLAELIRFVRDETDSQVAMHRGTIYIISGFGPGTFEPLITKKFRIDTARPGFSPRDDLEASGVEFYDGTDAVLSRSGRVVTVKNTEAQIDLCDVIFDGMASPTWWDYTCWYVKEYARQGAEWLRSKL